MRDCPRCGDPLSTDGTCTGCGWQERRRTAIDDTDAMRCAWVAGAERCRYAGTMSPNVNGGGPWYCAGHYGCDDGAHGQRIVEESRRSVRSHRITAEVMRQATKAALMARPVPTVPPPPPGVHYPAGRTGAFTRIVKIVARHAPHPVNPEDVAERAAIESERTA